MRKRLLIMLILGIGIAGLLLTQKPTQGQQNETLPNTKIKQEDPFEKPDVVKKGKKTKKQKNYSKRFRNVKPSTKIKLTEGSKLAKQKKYKGIISRTLRVPSIPTVGPDPSDSQFIGDLACASDAILIGTAKAKVSQLTEDESWVFTEYDVLVNHIFKNNNSLPINLNSEVKVARPGGDVMLDGYHFRMRDEIYEPFKKNGSYLLFLKAVPEPNSYTFSDAKGDFELLGNKFRSMSKVGISKTLEIVEKDNLINQIKKAVSIKCS